MPQASHMNHRLVVQTASSTQLAFVLRRYTDEERLVGDPWYVPRDEVMALQTLESVDLPVPRLVAADTDAVECDVATLLVTWLPGSPPEPPGDVDSIVERIPTALRAIHATEAHPTLRRYRPYFESDGHTAGDLHPPTWSRDPSLWEGAFEAVASRPPDGPIRFIHRDYHHGNTLWSGDALTGIIDWTTGCLGPPGIDVAQMRINLAWDYDLETADASLVNWQSVSGESEPQHPYWDLLDAVDWLSDDPPEGPDEANRYARYEDFVRRALSKLS